MARKQIFHTHITYFAFFLLVFLFSACEKREKDAPMEAVTKEQRLEWFKEAKFGLFIHWGAYSVLAGEWNGQTVPEGRSAEWIMYHLNIPQDIYHLYVQQFNPTQFNAEEWAQLAQDAGMKYLVITAKHHDGFAMYHSKVDPYNIVDFTPFDRDPIQELAVACRKRGIRFGVYYSHREDWNEPYAYGNDWDFAFDPLDHMELFEQRYLETKAKPQMRELLTGIDSLALIWFDRGLYTPEQAQEFIDLVHGIQPWCLINGRVGNYQQELMGDYQNMNDNGMPPGGIEEYWETPQKLNDNWGYNKFDQAWKSPAEVLRRLVTIVSRGGNYLLNVGPTAEGIIPEESQKVLREVGAWMQKNGESIYGTTASPFLDIPWGYCTVKGTKLYFHVFDPPEDGKLMLDGLITPVSSVFFLAQPEKKLSFLQDQTHLIIDLTSDFPQAINTVLVAEIDGPPEVLPPVAPANEEGGYTLDHFAAQTFGKSVKRFNRKGQFHISKWTAPQDSVRWYFDTDKPRSFRLSITYAAQPKWEGSDFLIEYGDQMIPIEVKPTGDWYEYQTFELGTITLDQPGRQKFLIHPAEGIRGYGMYFKSIDLIPF